MSMSHTPRLPLLGLGLSSVTLGATGLLLFLLPILGLPISGTGILVGLVGCGIALATERASVRLNVAGVVISSLAFALVWGISLAPSGFFAPRPSPTLSPPLLGRPYIPPPAPPIGKRMGRKEFNQRTVAMRWRGMDRRTPDFSAGT